MVQVIEIEELRKTVRSSYAARAREVSAPGGSCGCGSTTGSCCGGTGAANTKPDPITSNLYSDAEAAEVPITAFLASLGCGNPTALAELKPGEKVLDLGSGGGIDVLLSARRVGPTGFAYGLDMTDDMLALANKNAADAGLENVSFLKGQIEAIPLPENSVDVVISNCVINLSTDKAQVLQEAHRVLTPNGRFAVSDVVIQGDLPIDLRTSMEAWIGCVAGALEEREYRELLADAGFEDIDMEVTRVYDPHDLADSLAGGGGCCCGTGVEFDEASLTAFDAAGGRVVSAFVRARKP